MNILFTSHTIFLNSSLPSRHNLISKLTFSCRSSLHRPSIRPPQGGVQQRALPQGPPSGIPTPQSAASSRSSGGPTVLNTHFSPYGPTPSLVNNFRRQKASLESTRRSSDSRASARPIITVSPPYTNIHEGENAYTTPRSAPVPSGQSSPERPPTSLPTPTASDRTTTPESPTSVDTSSPSTSTHSVVPLPQVIDGQLPSATSCKEETLLRKNHFDVSPNTQPRRGTVSSANNQRAPATVGFPPNRTERRHISVLQLSRLKKEITANAPQVRKMPSDTFALGGARDVSPALSRSNTITISPPQSPDSNQSPPHSRPRAQTQSPPVQHGAGQGKRMPPPLKRTWHTPPTTGPPREPLPSPPVSATLTLPTPTTSDSSRNGPPSPSSSLRPRLTLPPVVPPKDMPSSSISRAQGKMSPDSAASVNLSVPSSPVRSSADTDTDRGNSSPPSPRTPVREDLSRKVLADENATAQELRDALQQQVDKYKRLSSYLLSLTERHALERAELVAKVELLERDRERREHEMKGLKWLVARSGGEEPARKDSDVMPGAAGSSAVRDRSGSAATSRTGASVIVSSPGTDGRMSTDSAAGSVEEGLAELQNSISEFIAAEKRPLRAQAGVIRGPAAARRRARSNTVPNGAPVCMQTQTSALAAKLVQSTKVARRTSSPVIPYNVSPGSFAQRRLPGVLAPGPRTGLGLGVGLDGASSSSPALSSSPSPDSRVDLHARCDSSTLSSLPSLSTIHSSSPSSGLSSIPETPRTDIAVLDDDPHAHLQANGTDKEVSPNPYRLSTSSTSSVSSGAGSGVSAGSSGVSASPSISQVLDRTKSKSSIPSRSHHQPEMEAILRRLRAFGQSHSP